MKTPPLPESVTVPPYDYAITVMDPEDAGEADDPDRIVGHWRFHPKSVIQVDTSVDYRMQASTLDHEIGHAILRETSGTRRLAVYAMNWFQHHPEATDEERGEFMESFEELIIEVTFEGAHAYRRFSPDVVKWIDRGLVKG